MRKILNLAASVSIFSAGGYLYIRSRTRRNLDQYNKILEAGTTKDASRLSNDSFGISWGFQADDIIMSKIDSGDYLFMKFQCEQCLAVQQYGRCMASTMFNLDQQFDSVGYAYRNNEGLFIIYNQFGITKIKSYAQLVSLPYLKGLTIQKLNDKNSSYHRKLKQLIQKQGNVDPSSQKKQSVVQMVNRINSILHQNKLSTIHNLRQLIQTQQQILVRTQTNRTLRSL